MFSICGVLKFLGCILYILFNHVQHLFHEFLNDFFQDFLFESFLWPLLGSLVTLIIFLLGQELGIHFLHASSAPLGVWVVTPPLLSAFVAFSTFIH
jgi:uncharacterized membrane protein